MVAEDDDSGEGTNSILDLTLFAPGVYTLMVTSYYEGEEGEYDLSVGLEAG